TATGRWMTRRAAEVKRDRQAIGGAGLEDWPITAPAQRLDATRWDIHLREAAIAGTRFDLGDGRLLVLEVDLHRSFQPRIRIAEARELPFIDRSGHGGAEIDVAFARSATDQGRKQAIGHIELVEQLELHECQIGPG